MADFTYSPSFGFDKEKEPSLSVAVFNDGYEQRTGLGINTVKGTWNLTFNRNDTTADLIEAFFDARVQGESFTWIPPGEVTQIKVKWSGFRRTRTDYRFSIITVTFKQVFGE